MRTLVVRNCLARTAAGLPNDPERGCDFIERHRPELEVDPPPSKGCTGRAYWKDERDPHRLLAYLVVARGAVVVPRWQWWCRGGGGGAAVAVVVRSSG